MQTFVLPRNAHPFSPVFPFHMSRPKILHKVHTLVKFTARKKVGRMSNRDASFYVNQKLHIHNPGPLWTTPVDKLVDSVENSELSTGIPIFSLLASADRADAYRSV